MSAVFAFALGAGAIEARTACADLALVLAIDASGSIDEAEFVLQNQGYAEAFDAPRVRAALAAAGQVDIGVVLWGDAAMAPQVLPLRRIAAPQDIDALGRGIASLPRRVTGDTDIGAGLTAALEMLRPEAHCALRRIINVSGDGRESVGARPRNVVPLVLARQRAQSLGIGINALAIQTEDANLAAWFRDRVITGPGAFVMQVEGFDTFGEALIEKLVREIALPGVAALPEAQGSARTLHRAAKGG